MKKAFIIDAHVHIGWMGNLMAPEVDLAALLRLMDRLNIQSAICSDMRLITIGPEEYLPISRRAFTESKGRVFYLGVYDPHRPRESLAILKKAVKWPGFVGIKIHPSWHRTMANDHAYRPAWEYAAENDVTILAHTWSVSDYNPAQKFSTPALFEDFVRDFPAVRFVLGHAGGRGQGRLEAIRLINAYPNVFLDFGGDIYCYRLIEDLVAAVPADRILFGSDYPMLETRANLARVLLADIPDDAKLKILRDNAAAVYGIGKKQVNGA